MIRLPFTRARGGQLSCFVNGKHKRHHITDNRAGFSLKLADHQRQNSPRQRRKREEYRALLASRRDIIENILGAIVLAIIILIAAFA